MEEKFTYFWKSKSPFSQWYSCKFSVDGINFTCAEQAMMYFKAKLFHDNEIAKEILKTSNPNDHKQLGRIVANFNKEIWESNCEKIVYTNNMAKFTQNLLLLERLKNTIGTTLVEASPYDTIWGIGLYEDDPRAKRRDQWKGKNLLGEILTKLREEIMKMGRDEN